MSKIANQITINGKINFAPKVSKTSKGRMVTFVLNFYSNKGKDGKGEYGNMPCVSYDDDVVNMIDNAGKDARIIVTGQLKANNYEDKSGNKVYGFQILVSNVGME